MFKRIELALVTAMGLMVSAAPAQTVSPAPTGRSDVGRPPTAGGPTVSPFLNLNRGGLPGVNYFGLVVPQIDTAQNLQLLQQQQLALGSSFQTGLGQQTQLLTTGHAATYFNTSHYFPLRYPIGGSAGTSNNPALGGQQNQNQAAPPPVFGSNIGFGLGLAVGR